MNGFLESLNYGQWILHALVLLPALGRATASATSASDISW